LSPVPRRPVRETLLQQVIGEPYVHKDDKGYQSIQRICQNLQNDASDTYLRPAYSTLK
jgi:hypothetical protein